ncbi:CBO0543 family protein [Anaeroselena agilis]|uniref:CBO0543 family protein n=1 Tax=Anaeroselena agilis TaxID=3063788 RepID=A0ABU3NVE0_9FIRM|nr:CBO0543 family protein [Selenomonadales bacterium 4137-cl]
MNMDIVLISANMLIHPLIAAFFYWRKPLPARRLLNLFIFSSWLSFTGNLLGLHFGAWDFTSPTIGKPATELLYDLLGMPPKTIMLVYLLKPSVLYNTVVIAIVSGLTISWEWAALNYSHLLVYKNWNLPLTYVAAFTIYAFLAYLWQKKIL